jgi:hypothetical protein
MKFAFEISATRFKKIFEKNIFPNGISYFLKHDSTRLKMSKNPFLNTFSLPLFSLGIREKFSTTQISTWEALAEIDFMEDMESVFFVKQ